NVGGGGLLGGCATIVRAVAPNVHLLGAQSEATNAMALSLSAGRIVAVDYLPTLADGLAGQIDDAAFEIGQRSLDSIATITEAEVAQSIAFLWREHRQKAEGAGA